MRFSIFLASVTLLLLFSISACSDEQTQSTYSPPSSQEYFPLHIGATKIYHVDSIYYKENQSADSVSLFFKESIIDTLIDLEGDLVYLASRSQRYKDNDAWEIKEVFTLKSSLTQAQRIENNQRLIVLTFPPKVNNPWDATAFFNSEFTITVRGEVLELYKDWESYYDDIEVPYSSSGISSDSTLIVYHANSTNLIEQRIFKEVYAKDIGLIYQKMSFLDAQSGIDMRTWPEDAEKGFELTKVLIEHY